jgi:hypothetical protein
VEVFKAQMKKAFNMSNLDLLCCYLDVEVRQDISGTALCQTHYTKRILDYNPTHTPMEEKLKLSRASKGRRLIRPITDG